MAVTFAEARRIVYEAEVDDWPVGTLKVERDGFEDATHWLILREAAELAESFDPNMMIPDQPAPLVSKADGSIEYVLPHLPEVAQRLDAMRPVRG